MRKPLSRAAALVIGLLALAALAATPAVAAGQGQGQGGPPPWGPGPGGPDVVHVMHGNGAARPGGGTTTPPLLTYRGGSVEQTPSVYLVFWGSQWSSDPSGEQNYLTNFLTGLYGTSEKWSASTTQYCQGVASGATSCAGTSANFVGHPGSSPLQGVYPDTSLAPAHPKQSQLAAEAVKAAGFFHCSNPCTTQFVIATAHNNSASGFGTSYCAWHSSTVSSTYGNLSYTNLPYITDAGASCGAGFVNGSTNGKLDGVSIVAGHEYAETITDPFPNSGWLDNSGAENGDKCAWISSGQGKSANATTANGSFPVQSLWSNNFGSGGCVISYTSAATQG